MLWMVMVEVDMVVVAWESDWRRPEIRVVSVDWLADNTVLPWLALCWTVVVDTRVVLICCDESIYTVVMEERRGGLERLLDDGLEK